ncbi:unnamed protein product [Caenorhabditis sp. 36 PRJEB53466]|nr:unnamed protein product [Caenorhabditis sp. 36 PRJEB53466]
MEKVFDSVRNEACLLSMGNRKRIFMVRCFYEVEDGLTEIVELIATIRMMGVWNKERKACIEEIDKPGPKKFVIQCLKHIFKIGCSSDESTRMTAWLNWLKQDNNNNQRQSLLGLASTTINTFFCPHWTDLNIMNFCKVPEYEFWRIPRGLDGSRTNLAKNLPVLTGNKSTIEHILREYFDMAFAEGCKDIRRDLATPEQAQKKYLHYIDAVDEGFQYLTGMDYKTAFRKMPVILKDSQSLYYCFLLETYLQYALLGMCRISDDNGTKLIAWNCYLEDRYTGCNREDLFGLGFDLAGNEFYMKSFDLYAKVAQRHPHHQEMMTLATVVDCILSDEQLCERLIEKYEEFNITPKIFISLTFAGHYEKIIQFFGKFKANEQSHENWFTANVCYLLVCAQKKNTIEAVTTWAKIMKMCSKWGYLGVLRFSRNSFRLPSFVNVEYAGHMATRILRNCLWIAIMKGEGEEWYQFGELTLTLCESLEDTFLNRNMIRCFLVKMSIPQFKFTDVDFVDLNEDELRMDERQIYAIPPELVEPNSFVDRETLIDKLISYNKHFNSRLSHQLDWNIEIAETSDDEDEEDETMVPKERNAKEKNMDD